MTLSSGPLAFLSNGRTFRKLYETVHVSSIKSYMNIYTCLLTNNLTIVDYINHDLKNNEKFLYCMNV